MLLYEYSKGKAPKQNNFKRNEVVFMKKMISCLAVLAMLAAVPTAAVYAADNAAVSVAAETSYDETDIRNIVGQWRYQLAAENKNVDVSAVDNGIITVNEDGTYTYTDLDGNTHSGTVKVDYDTFGGEYRVPFFAFYEGDKFFIGCYCQQNNPNAYLIGNGGMEQLLSVNADFSAIAGEWEELNGDGRVFDISANGTYTVTYPNNSTEQGFIKIGNEIFSENSDGKWYNFYNASGMAWISFQKTDDGTVNELKAGDFTLRRRNADTNADAHQEQAEGGKTDSKNESVSFDKEDKTKGAIRVMENFNVIMALTGASPAYTIDDGKVNGYVKVTDSRFNSVADLYAFIADNFTGEAKEVFIRYIDGYFIEKDGSLYVQFIPRSFYQFHTENGVTITDPAMDYCTATANKGDQLFGVGRAKLRCESGKWHIESYEFGDFYGVESHDVSEIAGTWDEVDTLYPRQLVIRNDGSFTLVFVDGRVMYGTVKVEDIGYPNGSRQTWFNLYDENDAFYTGFEATSLTPLNDLYTGQDGSEHFVRYIEPEHKYSKDELQKMAAKDYEEKTGIKPADTHSMTNAGGSVTVVFTDEKGEDFDAYTVDPDTGVGEKFSDGSAVNLPQTGVNSIALAGTLAGASAVTLLGVGAVIMSGKLRRKEEE